jgi:hypothetical protein
MHIFSLRFELLGVVRVPYQAARELVVKSANKFRFSPEQENSQ